MMDISSCEEEEYSLTSFCALTIEIQNSLFNNFFFIPGGIWNLESGSFSYLGNSVCKNIRNSAKFRGIPGKIHYKNTAEFREIPRNSLYFLKNSVFRRK
jgi:hypothetical protein